MGRFLSDKIYFVENKHKYIHITVIPMDCEDNDKIKVIEAELNKTKEEYKILLDELNETKEHLKKHKYTVCTVPLILSSVS